MITEIRDLTIAKSPVILYDDLNNNVAYLMENAEYATGESVNFMTFAGKGLIYVCITKEKAKELHLSCMSGSVPDDNKKFTVSVDYKTSTTGISAFERAETIRAFTQYYVQPNDFKRPGHIFPLISTGDVFKNPGVAEIACALQEIKSLSPVAYVCEILNEKGEIASKEEVEKQFNLPMITFNEVVQFQYEKKEWLQVLHRQEIGDTKVYTVIDTLFEQEMKIYTRAGKIRSKKIVFYEECQSGDVLGVNQCHCRSHFKDYYKKLIDKEIDGIVFKQKLQKRPTSPFLAYPVKSKLITRQVKALIEDLYQAQHIYFEELEMRLI
ncbi:3,4-dihydroxy-2-butanone-4-phosphate synthase [Alteribacillus sp. JSM 102045]|uniref:3,4-dihydroxy-2-butanone-4-phosphate synthase n=1 Tax=Alteribacillus sp. JSM 102045 TaxID=1562101 RepID=UPI0035C17658